MEEKRYSDDDRQQGDNEDTGEPVFHADLIGLVKDTRLTAVPTLQTRVIPFIFNLLTTIASSRGEQPARSIRGHDASIPQSLILYRLCKLPKARHDEPDQR